MSSTVQSEVFHMEVPKKKGQPTERESSFLIPDGHTLRLTRFSGGHEYSNKEVRVELLLRSGGSDTIIAVGYGTSFSYLIDRDFLGDGSKEIVFRFVNGDSGALSMTAWWDGVTYE